MLLCIVFVPLVAAVLILCGTPARATALLGSGLTVLATLTAFLGYNSTQTGFQ